MAANIARYLILIVLLISIADGRILSLNPFDDGLISDGINDRDSSVTTNLSSCRHQYGFLPCAENAAGYIFLIVVYQVLLIVGDKLIGSGSDVVFYVTGAKIGGIIFRIMRALPSMMLMIISGVLSDKQNAQSQVSVVVGVYAGITVFSLTVQWFMTMLSVSKSLKKEADEHEHEETSGSINCFPKKQNFRILIENGVEVDDDTCRTAKIMLTSLIPYVVLQLVYAFETTSGKRIITLISLIVSSSSLISYFVYQIRDPWMQKRTFEDVTKEMFSVFDKNGDNAIDLEEFVEGVQEYLDKAMKAVSKSERPRAVEEFYKCMSEEKVYSRNDVLKSVSRVVLGIAMLTFLAGPLMGTILDLSNAMNFPSFVISFVAIPLAMNGRAAVEAVLLPSARKKKSSLTFSEIYGGVIMNNMAGLTTLLAIVYAKDLTWDFSAEVLTIMVVCAIVGTHAFLSKTYHLWTCIPALLLYPFSLGLFYFCQVFLSWN